MSMSRHRFAGAQIHKLYLRPGHKEAHRSFLRRLDIEAVRGRDMREGDAAVLGQPISLREEAMALGEGRSTNMALAEQREEWELDGPGRSKLQETCLRMLVGARD